MHIEDRTARLTILIDPRKKAMLEQLCAAEDVTPSQLVRKLIRGFIEGRLGRPWATEEEPAPAAKRLTHPVGATARRRLRRR